MGDWDWQVDPSIIASRATPARYTPRHTGRSPLRLPDSVSVVVGLPGPRLAPGSYSPSAATAKQAVASRQSTARAWFQRVQSVT